MKIEQKNVEFENIDEQNRKKKNEEKSIKYRKKKRQRHTKKKDVCTLTHINFRQTFIFPLFLVYCHAFLAFGFNTACAIWQTIYIQNE